MKEMEREGENGESQSLSISSSFPHSLSISSQPGSKALAGGATLPDGYHVRVDKNGLELWGPNRLEPTRTSMKRR